MKNSEFKIGKFRETNVVKSSILFTYLIPAVGHAGHLTGFPVNAHNGPGSGFGQGFGLGPNGWGGLLSGVTSASGGRGR